METLEIQRKVRKVYLEFVKKGELMLIDGDKPKEAVADALYSKVSSLLKR
jgi:thymidylate kinase